MKNPTTKEQRKLRDIAFKMRELPRMLWNSAEDGPAVIGTDGRYVCKPKVVKKKHVLTEAQDNAIGRAIRRRQNKRLRGWLPFAKR